MGKLKFLCAFLGVTSSAISCSLAELTPEQIQQELRKTGYVSTRSGDIQLDSLEMLSRLQSDEDLLLLNQIWFKDGRFVLSLTREDAVSLGISDELYEKYVDYVNIANDNLR